MSNMLRVPSGSLSAKALSGISVGMASHPYVVRKLSDLRQELRQDVQKLLPPDSNVRRIFVVPKQVLFDRRLRRDVPEQVLVFTDAGVIHVQAAAATGEPAQVHLIQSDEVLYLELALILLYGRIEIISAANGQVRRTVVEFNVVGWQMMQPAVQTWLGEISSRINPPESPPENATINPTQLEVLPYKFVSGVDVYLLAPGEKLEGLVFQPDIWKSRLGIFRHQLAPPMVVALTDRYLSIIEEKRAAGRSNSYGWIFTFIPRSRITGMRSQPAPPGRQIEIEVETQDVQFVRQLELSQEVAEDLESLWRAHGGPLKAP